MVKRKRATSGPAKVTRVKKAVVGNSSAAAHHAVRVAPFANTTPQPKILDGAIKSSLSRRLQAVGAFKNSANNPLGQSIMHVIMAPTLGLGATVFGSEEGHTYRGGSTKDPAYLGFNGQTVGWAQTNAAGAVAPTWSANPSIAEMQGFKNLGGFNQWRIVSQGLRMELTNTDEENDGWFEACRFNWSNRYDQLALTPIDGSVTLNKVVAAPEENILHQLLQPMAMVEQPGYKTGLLRDLKKVEFQLHPKNVAHPIVHVRETFMLHNQDDMDFQTDTKTHRFDNESALAVQAAEELIDRNMDWVYIRLHCRTNNGGTSAGSQFLFNAMQNVEMAFSPSSDFATFQTPNNAHIKTEKITGEMNMDMSASSRRRG